MHLPAARLWLALRLAAPVAMGLALSAAAPAATVQVAVAANFAAPMKQIAQDFERDTGHQARLSAGSTGKFHAQIKRGAPFDVLLAADDVTPARLAQDGLAVADSRFTYATGQLVLWSARADLVDARGEVLRGGGFRKLALAAPGIAPYGLAAVETLTALGLLATVQPKFVQGESIGQAFNFVASGNADLGFVALSQVFDNGQLQGGSAWVVPAGLHRPLRQEAVLLTKGQGNPAAAALLKYLQSAPARAVIRRYGYEP